MFIEAGYCEVKRDGIEFVLRLHRQLGPLGRYRRNWPFVFSDLAAQKALRGKAGGTSVPAHFLLRGGQPARQQVCALDYPKVRFRDVRSLPQNVAAPSQPTQRTVVALDDAAYHHAASLHPLLKRYRGVLSLLFLPPYSPQFAAIERVRRLSRCLVTHNRYFATLDELMEAACLRFDRWRKPDIVLRRLCGIT